MKCMLISYLLALIVFWNINYIQMSKIKNENPQADEIKKLIDCKVCQEMFQYEFNYEKLLKDDLKISVIKSNFEEISEEYFNFKDYFSPDNLDFISKEISMQYFFKGEDSQFSSEEHIEKFKICKTKVVGGKNEKCDLLKFKLCENILSIEGNLCVNFNKRISSLKNNIKKEVDINIENSQEIMKTNSNSFLKNNSELKKLRDNNFSDGENKKQIIKDIDNSLANKNLSDEINFKKKNFGFIDKNLDNNKQINKLYDKENLEYENGLTNNPSKMKQTNLENGNSYINTKNDLIDNLSKFVDNYGNQKNINDTNKLRKFSEKDINFDIFAKQQLFNTENSNTRLDKFDGDREIKQNSLQEILSRLMKKKTNNDSMIKRSDDQNIFPNLIMNGFLKEKQEDSNNQINFQSLKNMFRNNLNGLNKLTKSFSNEKDVDDSQNKINENKEFEIMKFLQKNSNSNKISSNMNSYLKNLNNLNSENINNFASNKLKNFGQDNQDLNAIEKLGQSSYLEMTPEYIQKNFDSNPKTHWQPPKPVLLENFENNIGSQLKEISNLASDISKYENKLKQMKQQLANKLETFQSTYNVVQKTISEISKLVSIPNFPSYIKSPSSFTEDDWDESAKPKFLNK